MSMLSRGRPPSTDDCGLGKSQRAHVEPALFVHCASADGTGSGGSCHTPGGSFLVGWAGARSLLACALFVGRARTIGCPKGEEHALNAPVELVVVDAAERGQHRSS